VITKEEYDRLVADQAEATATVHTTEAAVERATLDLTWTKINAPIDGLVSRELITVGNLVVADTTPLTTILRFDPMYVYFDVDEHTVLRIQDLIREGKFKTARHNRVPIRMGLADDVGYPLEGFINFVENRLDRATGTIEVRGEFANPIDANGSFPISAGLFGRVRMDLGVPHDALWVSEKSLLSDQDKKYVYIVDDKQEVVRRDVVLGTLEAGYRVIEKGLQPTDRVIINGLQRVREGIVVNAKETELTGPPESKKSPAEPAADAKSPAPAADAKPAAEPASATPPATADAPAGAAAGNGENPVSERPVVPIQANPQR
jgi:multidrug efflux system membrane fusion protein